MLEKAAAEVASSLSMVVVVFITLLSLSTPDVGSGPTCSTVGLTVLISVQCVW